MPFTKLTDPKGANADRTDGLWLDKAQAQWHPVALTEDLPFRHVFHSQLLGYEFAVWRADDNFVNVWENRCLHRGLRLSLGINDGRELKCQYHGWRYSNRTAGCTYIPAHPADAPARTITNRTFPAVERYGLVWTALQPQGDPPLISALNDEMACALRPIPVSAPPDVVMANLHTYGFQPNGDLDGNNATTEIVSEGELSVTLRARSDDSRTTTAAFFVQPLDSARSVIRGVIDSAPEDKLAMLRHHNARLSRLRDRIEQVMATRSVPAPLVHKITPLPIELSEMPREALNRRKATLRVQVTRKWSAAEGIAGFELKSIKGFLPTFQPGAHIDLHLPNGEVRQYSLINAPGETDGYTIGVKREPESRGGSACLHEVVREGDVIAISEPRNNFQLRRDATRTLLVAGGIGVTPLLAMAQALHHSRLPYELHYFVQSVKHVAFPERVAGLEHNVHLHLGLNPAMTEEALDAILSRYESNAHAYICGPAPMLNAARCLGAAKGWPEQNVHFEYFKNTNKIDDSSSFEIALARSVVTLQVPGGKTILEVIREAGVDIPSSCEQGACGTCMVGVIDGTPDHQDVYLNDAERRSNAKILTCVSRSKSQRLVLDI